MQDDDYEGLKKRYEPWYITFRGLIVFVVVASLLAVIFKTSVAPLLVNLQNLTMSEIVSLAISIFAIAMSFAFYFQASQTSNTFYDNTYKFTKDVSEILGRMEGMFGEKLTHLDDNYSRMNTRLDQFSPARAEAELNETKTLADESEDRRDELIESLLERAQLQGDEKESFLERLKEAESEILASREKVAYLEKRLIQYQNSNRHNPELYRPRGIGSYLENKHPSALLSLVKLEILPFLGDAQKIAKTHTNEIKKLYGLNADRVSSAAKFEMSRSGLADDEGKLTHTGAVFIKKAALDLFQSSKVNSQSEEYH